MVTATTAAAKLKFAAAAATTVTTTLLTSAERPHDERVRGPGQVELVLQGHGEAVRLPVLALLHLQAVDGEEARMEEGDLGVAPAPTRENGARSSNREQSYVYEGIVSRRGEPSHGHLEHR